MGNKVLKLEQPKEGNGIPIEININSNQDIVDFMNSVLRLYAKGTITSDQLKNFAYPMQILQTSLKNRQMEQEFAELKKKIESLAME